MDELKPCPFCGENQQINYVELSNGLHYIECEKCGAAPHRLGAWDRETAVKYWNSVNRWIPCSDRLPEYGEEVLVWFEYFRYGEYNRLYQTHGIGEFFGKHGKRESWLINHETGWQKLKVFAWMPLPEPPEM